MLYPELASPTGRTPRVRMLMASSGDSDREIDTKSSSIKTETTTVINFLSIITVTVNAEKGLV